MNIALMVGAVGFVVAVVAYGNWRATINRSVIAAACWVWKLLLDPKTCRVAETFCNESAVLWFVFPLLDTVYEHRPPDLPLLHKAYWVAGMFFLFAVILSHAAREKNGEL